MNKIFFVLMAAYLSSSISAYAQVVDDCVNGVDKFDNLATDWGTTLNNQNRALTTLAQSCEQATQQTPQSTSLRLNLAKTLIWSNRESAATIQLETLIGSDKETEAMTLASAICALGKGNRSTINTACGWASEYGIDDPDLAEQAADNMLKNGKPDLGLQFMSDAANNGSFTATQYLSKICSGFQPTATPTFSSLPNSLATLDELYVAATACEAAFINTQSNDPAWSDFGFKYAESILYFDDYESAAGALLELAESSNQTTASRAIDVLDGLCTATAGDLDDPDFGAEGVSDLELLPDRSRPICEAAAYVWPENGRLHYNLARIYSFMGPSEQTSMDAALSEAERLGYPLAKKLLTTQPINFDPKVYNVAALIQAFHNQDIKTPNDNPFLALTYAKSLNDYLASDQILFFGDETAREIHLFIKASFTFKAEQKLLDPAVINQAVDTSLKSFGQILGSFMLARQSSIDRGVIDPVGELSALLKSAHNTPLRQVELLREYAVQDAKRMVKLWETNPEDFKKIYSGLISFLES